jgi:hypothetical protein
MDAVGFANKLVSDKRRSAADKKVAEEQRKRIEDKAREEKNEKTRILVEQFRNAAFPILVGLTALSRQRGANFVVDARDKDCFTANYIIEARKNSSNDSFKILYHVLHNENMCRMRVLNLGSGESTDGESILSEQYFKWDKKGFPEMQINTDEVLDILVRGIVGRSLYNPPELAL